MTIEAWVGLVGLLTTIVGAAGWLGGRLAGVTSAVQAAHAGVARVEVDVTAIMVALDAERAAREQLSGQVSAVRERLAVVEAWRDLHPRLVVEGPL